MYEYIITIKNIVKKTSAVCSEFVAYAAKGIIRKNSNKFILFLFNNVLYK